MFYSRSISNGVVVHVRELVANYPRKTSVGGKDPEWNARKESRRQMLGRLRTNRVDVPVPCSRAEARILGKPWPHACDNWREVA